MKYISTFTQAVSSFSWYDKSKETDFILYELDKDLKKWGAGVDANVDEKRAGCVIEASFGQTAYSFILDIHEQGTIIELMANDVPEEYKFLLKQNTRVRNVLKNFTPIVFDKIVADNQLKLVQIGSSSDNLSSYCVWTTNVAGLGLSIACLSINKPTPPIDERSSWVLNILTKNICQKQKTHVS